jgi:hypothetical protein
MVLMRSTQQTVTMLLLGPGRVLWLDKLTCKMQAHAVPAGVHRHCHRLAEATNNLTEAALLLLLLLSGDLKRPGEAADAACRGDAPRLPASDAPGDMVDTRAACCCFRISISAIKSSLFSFCTCVQKQLEHARASLQQISREQVRHCKGVPHDRAHVAVEVQLGATNPTNLHYCHTTLTHYCHIQLLAGAAPQISTPACPESARGW